MSLQPRVLQWVLKPVFKQEDSQAEELGLPVLDTGRIPLPRVNPFDFVGISDVKRCPLIRGTRAGSCYRPSEEI